MKELLFLHGKEGTPFGSKPAHLRENGYDVIAPNLDKDDWAASIAIAHLIIENLKPTVIVGSSRGGAVAAGLYAPGATKILIAPAWKAFGGVPRVDDNTVILHYRDDDIVPFEDSVELVEKFGCKLIECGESHRMNDPKTLAILADLVAKNI